MSRRCGLITFCLALDVALTTLPIAQSSEAPSRPEKSSSAVVVLERSAIEALLKSEPLALANWPTWRERLLDWFGDRSGTADAAYLQAREFMRQQSAGGASLPEPLKKDALAWYFLAGGLLDAESADVAKAEKAIVRSLELDDSFARAHRNYAMILLQKAGKFSFMPEVAKARKELQRARQLDPSLQLAYFDGQVALVEKDYARAQTLFQSAMREEQSPQVVASAGRAFAAAVIDDDKNHAPKAPRIKPILDQLPDDGGLWTLYGAALAVDDRPHEALAAFDQARTLGQEPRNMLSTEFVSAVEDAAATPWYIKLGWIFAGFVGVYAVVMLGMAAAGVVLARFTRGDRAIALLPDQPVSVVAGGQIPRAGGESLLARLYAFSLFLGLVLFYASIPFVIVGVLVATGGLLWLIIMTGHIPIKLFLIILVVGALMAWAVLKSIFAGFGRGGFGIRQTRETCPRLFATLDDVAHRVDTEPITEVYLSPGSEIGVHQEGRGPLGLFGAERRVLTLGMSSLRLLTLSELKAILAHEYAHFSHKDTFYSRFIHRVDVSIHEALSGMGQAGGKLNYVNPFFWFLYLYYRAYSLLSAGFSRSREFLADRMACLLYGSNVFVSALTKVAVEGTVTQEVAYNGALNLLSEGKHSANMYAATDPGGSEMQPEVLKMRKQLDEERESLFASHPTHRERLAAAAVLPQARTTDDSPAASLLDDAANVEKELTEFFSGHILSLIHAAEAAASS